MRVIETDIAGVRIIEPRRFADRRGYFSEAYQHQRMFDAGIREVFVQDNDSFSTEAGTIRGMHFQRPPRAQAKLVRVVRGSILDVVVDLRRSSPTYLRRVSVTLTAEEGNQIFVPIGCAHGLCTLEPSTHVLYKVSDYYAPECEGGIRWDDARLGIAWPVAGSEAVVSDRDLEWPGLDALGDVFP